MAVRVPGTGRGDGDLRMRRIDERLGRRRSAAVVRDLEEVDLWEPIGEEGWVDALFDVAHQQRAAFADPTEQHDRHVVDASSAVRRRQGHTATDRPQDLEVDLVDSEPIAGRESQSNRRTGSGQVPEPRGVARAWPAHPRLEDARDVVTLEEERETGDMILVGMTQDDSVDPAVPGRDAGVERDEQAAGIRTAVDEQPAAVGARDEDRVTLADIEHGDGRDASRSCRDDGARHDEAHEQGRDARAPDGVLGMGRAGRVRNGLLRSGRRGDLQRSPPCPPGGDADANRRGNGRDEVERWGEGDAGKRQTCCRFHDRHEDSQHDPPRRGEDGTRHHRPPCRDDGSTGQRHDADGHRGGDERDDDEVDGG
jgi:hypothetical protein